jgi:hypothetical protein
MSKIFGITATCGGHGSSAHGDGPVVVDARARYRPSRRNRFAKSFSCVTDWKRAGWNRVDTQLPGCKCKQRECRGRGVRSGGWKSVTCVPGTSVYTCILAGANVNEIANGVVAVVTDAEQQPDHRHPCGDRSGGRIRSGRAPHLGQRGYGGSRLGYGYFFGLQPRCAGVECQRDLYGNAVAGRSQRGSCRATGGEHPCADGARLGNGGGQRHHWDVGMVAAPRHSEPPNGQPVLW